MKWLYPSFFLFPSRAHCTRTESRRARSSDIFNIIHTHGKKENRGEHRCDDPFLKWDLICCADKHGECALLVSFQRAYDNASCAIPRREKLTREITRVEITISCIFILYFLTWRDFKEKDISSYSLFFLFSIFSFPMRKIWLNLTNLSTVKGISYEWWIMFYIVLLIKSE